MYEYCIQPSLQLSGMTTPQKEKQKESYLHGVRKAKLSYDIPVYYIIFFYLARFFVFFWTS